MLSRAAIRQSGEQRVKEGRFGEPSDHPCGVGVLQRQHAGHGTVETQTRTGRTITVCWLRACVSALSPPPSGDQANRLSRRTGDGGMPTPTRLPARRATIRADYSQRLRVATGVAALPG